MNNSWKSTTVVKPLMADCYQKVQERHIHGVSKVRRKATYIVNPLNMSFCESSSSKD